MNKFTKILRAATRLLLIAFLLSFVLGGIEESYHPIGIWSNTLKMFPYAMAACLIGIALFYIIIWSFHD